MITDERSMIGREASGHFDLALKIITKNFSPFGEVSLLIIGYFLQLLLANQKAVSMKPSKGSYRSFNGCLWGKFELHELVEIVRQSSNPDFAECDPNKSFSQH